MLEILQGGFELLNMHAYYRLLLMCLKISQIIISCLGNIFRNINRLLDISKLCTVEAANRTVQQPYLPLAA